MRKEKRQALIALSSLLILIMSSCNYVQKRTNLLEKQEINGVVTEKYREKWNHGSPVVKLNSGIVFGIGSWAKGSHLWESIEIGDSICKPAGTLSLKLFKKSGEQELFKFNE